MFRIAQKSDLAKLFIAYKKYWKLGDQSETARFNSDEDMIDFLRWNVENQDNVVYICGEDKITAFMIVNLLQTPFVNVQRRLWLEAVWKYKKARIPGFWQAARQELVQLALKAGCGTIEGLVASDRKDLDRLYRLIGCSPRGTIQTLIVPKLITLEGSKKEAKEWVAQ